MSNDAPYATMTEKLLAEASAATGIPVAKIKGPVRRKPVFRPRAAICWTLRKRGMHLAVIGRMMGLRDHTTIINACRRARALRDTDPEFLALCDRLAGVVQ